jgi:protein-S-isoprenylcysteine O-methyltransferase Ste14
MSLGHLVLTATLSFYLLIATHYEERDLVSHYGDTYRAYQKRVPRFIPRLTGAEPDRSTGTLADVWPESPVR